jgi:hypothetical protein
MYSLEQKLKIIQHADKYGIPSAIDAFGVSKTSIYDWTNNLVEHWGDQNYLKNKSTRPKHVRTRIWDQRIWEFIQRIRIEHPGLTKEKVEILLKGECSNFDIKCPSIATVGRIITGYKKNHQIPNWSPKLSFYANNSTFRSKQRKKLKKPRPKKADFLYPGQRVQLDSITLIKHGVRRYLIEATDVYSRFTYSKAYKTLSSRSAKDFFQELEQYFPFINKNTEFQTDNGSEYMDEFKTYLETNGYKQYWNYPHSPKMNAYIERFNGTIQQEFVYRNLPLLFQDVEQFNIKLHKQILWYNTERPHLSLQLQSPMQYILQQGKISEMWWTRT